jgi:hypothetical protein
VTRIHDEDERLTLLLRAIPVPEPSPDFLAGARRRYLEALEARYRREVLTGLVAVAVAFGIAVALVLSLFEPLGLIAGVAVTISGLARWMAGVEIVLSNVPSLVWIPVVLVSVVSLLSIVPLLRVRPPAAVK